MQSNLSFFEHFSEGELIQAIEHDTKTVMEAKVNASVRLEALCSVTLSLALAIYINQLGALCAIGIQIIGYFVLGILTALQPKRHQTQSVGAHEFLANY